MSLSRTKSVLVAAAIAAGGVLPVVTATPAHAACPTGIVYGVSSTPRRIPFRNVVTYKDGKGGTLSVARSYSGTASYAVVAGAESEVGAVLAKAKVTISAAVEKTNYTGTTNTYTHRIKAGKYGNARYVSWGKRVHWRKYRNNANCTSTFLGSGTIDFPTTTEGWFYWETSA
jgi:hypothetical protein